MSKSNESKEKAKELTINDPFWVMRNISGDQLDNEELYDLYIELGLFKNEEEKANAENFLADQILLDLEE